MFGFTPAGLKEWYERMNDVSGSELERSYLAQEEVGRFQPVTLSWGVLYTRLTTEEIITLSKKYRFTLFLALQSSEYPFEVIAEDPDYRLYRITTGEPR